MYESISMWIAYHLPKRIVYWSFIRAATMGEKDQPYPGNPTERIAQEIAESFRIAV